jgi:hypothetical protein
MSALGGYSRWDGQCPDADQSGYVGRDVIIHVAPEACPVIIHALGSHSYVSHDYNESDRRSDAVKVVSSARE